MHIKTACPRCQTTYQVDPSLRGKRMRCPNQLCRTIFEVAAVEDAVAPAPTPAAPPAPVRQSGGVGDMVPILSGEAVAPAAPAPPPEAKVPAPPPAPPPKAPAEAPPAWQQPPPIRSRPAAVVEPTPAPEVPVLKAEPPVKVEPALKAEPPVKAAPQVEAPRRLSADEELAALFDLGMIAAPTEDAAPPAEPGGGPTELPAGTWDAPPVRLTDGQAPPASPAETPPTDTPAEAPPARSYGRLLAMGLLLLVASGTVALVVHLNTSRAVGNEEQRYERAKLAYQKGDLTAAAEQFHELARDFADSARLEEYRFFAELSDVRQAVQVVQTDAEDAFREVTRLSKFCDENKDSPFFEKQKKEVWESFHWMVKELIGLAKRSENHNKLEDANAILKGARKVYAYAVKIQAPNPAVARETEQEFAAVAQLILAKERRRDLLAQLQALEKHASAAGVQKGRELARLSGLAKDPEVKALVDKLPAAHQAAVKYVPFPFEVPKNGLLEDRVPGILIAPRLVGQATKPTADARPVLALARGVLYALEPGDGQVRWAVRLGSDSTTLPLWLPAEPAAPGRVLALSADTGSLLALDGRDGKTLWSHTLSAPCRARPLVVNRRALLPLTSGRVEEVDCLEGRLLGFYELGQPVTAACHQPETDLVYLTGDQFCIYILDVAEKRCAGLLYADHPRGALVCAPAAFTLPETPAKEEGKPRGRRGYLLLCQAEDAATTRLRTFALPVTQPDSPPALPDRTLPGLASFAPQGDAATLALVTDAGAVLLEGRKQRGTLDSDFFPLYSGTLPRKGSGRGPERAEILHAAADDVWLVGLGQLHHLRNTFTAIGGEQWRPWPLAALQLGSPLHESQVQTGADGKATAFVVAEAPDGHGCWATAVALDRGTVRWRRQLGLVCRGPVVRSGDRVLALDQGGTLFAFDSKTLQPPADHAWLTGGRPLATLTLGPEVTPHVLHNQDKTEVYWVFGSGSAKTPRLAVWRYRADKGDVKQLDLPPLEAALAGTPALDKAGLVLPLANGILYRQPLADGSRAVPGPRWRHENADADALGHVVALGDEQFLATDGSSGVTWLDGSGSGLAVRATAKLGRRVAAEPVVLPTRDGKPRVVVVDAEHTLTLFQGTNLEKVHAWKLGGPVTAGPFARGSRLLCGVGQGRLVLLDPDQEEPVRELTLSAGLAGPPELVDGVLVVADVAGRFHSFDPVTGNPYGPGYALRASVAPAAGPVAFGDRFLFAPLTDGTVLLLPRRYFQDPWRYFLWN